MNMRKSQVNPIFAKPAKNLQQCQHLSYKNTRSHYSERERSLKNQNLDDTLNNELTKVNYPNMNSYHNYEFPELNNFKLPNPKQLSLKKNYNHQSVSDPTRKDYLKNNFVQETKILQQKKKIKIEQSLFQNKVRASNLLEELGFQKTETSEIVHIQDQIQLMSYIALKIKVKMKAIIKRTKEISDCLDEQRAMRAQSDDIIKYLTDTNEILKHSQAKAKQKLEQIKEEWVATSDKLILKQRELEEKDNQIFKLKRVYEDCQLLLAKSQSTIEQLKKEIIEQHSSTEFNLKQLRLLLTNYNLEKKQYQADLENQQTCLQESLIKQKMLEQELEKYKRDQVRWKERFQWLDKERGERITALQQELHFVSQEYQTYQIEYPSSEFQNLKQNLEIILNQQALYKEKLLNLQQQTRQQKKTISELQNRLWTLQNSFQDQYLSKCKALEKIKEDQIKESEIANKQELISLKTLYQNQLYIKLQEQNIEWSKKINKIQMQYQEKISKIEDQKQKYKQELNIFTSKFFKHNKQKSQSVVTSQLTQQVIPEEDEKSFPDTPNNK